MLLARYTHRYDRGRLFAPRGAVGSIFSSVVPDEFLVVSGDHLPPHDEDEEEEQASNADRIAHPPDEVDDTHEAILHDADIFVRVFRTVIVRHEPVEQTRHRPPEEESPDNQNELSPCPDLVAEGDEPVLLVLVLDLHACRPPPDD